MMRLAPDHRQRVAAIYTEAVAAGRRPNIAVADHFGCRPRTAERWVYEARLAGLIAVMPRCNCRCCQKHRSEQP